MYNVDEDDGGFGGVMMGMLIEETTIIRKWLARSLIEYSLSCS